MIGGAEIGATAVRQLLRGALARRLSVGLIRVIDRHAGCAAEALVGPGTGDRPEVVLEVAEWGAFLRGYVRRADPASHLVPYHWAPHLLFDWLAAEIEAKGGEARRTGPPAKRGLLFDGLTGKGDRALSHAGWICPPLCIEPEICPHTAATRHWALADELAQVHPPDEVDERIVFPCLHLSDGIGTVPLSALWEASARITAALSLGPRTYLVATSSHCHALAARLLVSPRVEQESEKP